MEPSRKTYLHPATGQKSDNPFDILDWLFGRRVPAKGTSSTVSVQEIGNALHPNDFGHALRPTDIIEYRGLFEEWARERSLVVNLSAGDDDTYSLSNP